MEYWNIGEQQEQSFISFEIPQRFNNQFPQKEDGSSIFHYSITPVLQYSSDSNLRSPGSPPIPGFLS